MAVPKRKTSHARKMKRRSNVWKLETPTNLVKCPQCGEYNLAYRVCKACAIEGRRGMTSSRSRFQ